MFFKVLASDYDDTLAYAGQIERPALEAVRRLKECGRRVVLVTGRETDDLKRTCSCLELFDLVVAENGAVLIDPAADSEELLADAPPPEFFERLSAAQVEPLSHGRIIVSTREPHEKPVLDAIRELGLELQILFNKGAVMVLPTGVNKATGLAAALRRLQLSPLNTVGVGDAENDHALLDLCGCGVAVANAVPMLQENADLVTRGERGRGVAELIGRLIEDDLADVPKAQARRAVLLGHRADGTPVEMPFRDVNLLIAGSSGGGKTTFALGILERLNDRGFQFGVVDPEGDYEGFECAVAVGDQDHAPSLERAVDLLSRVEHNVAVNLLGVPLGDRPAFLGRLMAAVAELRDRFARPHWMLIDEAHHMLSSETDPARGALSGDTKGMIFATVHPDQIERGVLEGADLVVALGADVDDAFAGYAKAAGVQAPKPLRLNLERGEAVLWDRRGDAGLVRFTTEKPRQAQRRHARKYAEGDLGEDRSFVFTGPDGRLKLKAQNLLIFLQMADGVDDDTWRFHLREGHVSAWFREQIKNDELAGEAEEIEADEALGADESRARIRRAVEQRYTAPEQPAS